MTNEGDVRLNDGVAPLGGSNVITTDIIASNGVLHVVDTVLINEAIFGS